MSVGLRGVRRLGLSVLVLSEEKEGGKSDSAQYVVSANHCSVCCVEDVQVINLERRKEMNIKFQPSDVRRSIKGLPMSVNGRRGQSAIFAFCRE